MVLVTALSSKEVLLSEMLLCESEEYSSVRNHFAKSKNYDYQFCLRIKLFIDTDLRR